MFDWYFGYPPLARLLIALIPLGLAAGAFFLGRVFWPWAWGIGIVMLCCAFPTDGERNKWGDW